MFTVILGHCIVYFVYVYLYFHVPYAYGLWVMQTMNFVNFVKLALFLTFFFLPFYNIAVSGRTFLFNFSLDYNSLQSVGYYNLRVARISPEMTS